MFGINRHLYPFQGISYALTDFFRRHAEILRTKGHVLFYDGCNDLVIGILEDHAHLLADIPDMLGVIGPQATNFTRAFCRYEKDVEMLGQRRLSRTISADNGYKFPWLYFQRYIFYSIYGLAIFICIGMTHMLQFYHRCTHARLLTRE